MSEPSSAPGSATPSATSGDESEQSECICNVDPNIMRHFTAFVKCNYGSWQAESPLPDNLECELRRHYYSNHQYVCKACKRGEFRSKSEMAIHVREDHKDYSYCSHCNSVFRHISALVSHIESGRDACAMTPSTLQTALDPASANSPLLALGCIRDPEVGRLRLEIDLRVEVLNAFSRTLRRVHENALADDRSHKTSEIAHGFVSWSCCTCPKHFSTLAALVQHVESSMKEHVWRSKVIETLNN